MRCQAKYYKVNLKPLFHCGTIVKKFIENVDNFPALINIFFDLSRRNSHFASGTINRLHGPCG